MKPFHIAIVDDDPNIRQIVEAYLQKEGYETISVESAEDALRLKETNPPDLWVLDIMLPGMNGYEFCRRIRMEAETPIIMISARDEEVDKILGLELGSDDYLTKPFSPRELVARVNRALRRWEHMKNGLEEFLTAKEEFPSEQSARGTLVLDKEKRLVFWAGVEVEVTSKEFQVLRLVSEHPNRAFSRDELLTLVWGDDYFGSDRVVDDLIRRIRKKLENIPLETVWGFGYRLRVTEGPREGMSLQYRITLMFGLLLFIVTGISASLIHSFLLDNLIDQQKKELVLKGQFWIEKASHSSENLHPEAIAELDRLFISNRKVEILLLGKKKKVLYTTFPTTNLNKWLQALERRTEKRKDKNIWMIDGDDYVVVALPLANDEKQRLILASPVRGLKDVRLELAKSILVVLLVGAVSAVLLSFFMTRSMVNPLNRLTKEIKKVQFRRFSEVEFIPARGEIAEVTESVYFMAQELERFHEIQRQFFQNASHELKTPLMSIQGYAEGIRDGIFTGKAAQQGLDVIVSETSRLKHIVTEIILLAKLESEEDLFHPADISATELINRAVERLRPIQLQQNIGISVRTPGIDPILHVDEGKFLQALLNIVGNALRHAKENIEIKIEAGEEKQQAIIEVIDDGEGIPMDLLPHLFHRFIKGKRGIPDWDWPFPERLSNGQAVPSRRETVPLLVPSFELPFLCVSHTKSNTQGLDHPWVFFFTYSVKQQAQSHLFRSS